MAKHRLIGPDAERGPGCGETTVNPQPFWDHLAATVEQRSIPRRLRTLAEEAPTITDEQLADRLGALADRLAALP